MNITMRRLLRPVLTLATLGLLGGCAPSFGGASFGPGLGVGLTSRGGLGLSSSTCLLYGTSSPQEAIHSNAAALAGARMKQIAAIETRLRSGSQSLLMQMEGWKRLAAGGC